MTHWHIVDNESGVFFWVNREIAFGLLSFFRNFQIFHWLHKKQTNRKKCVWMPVWILIHFAGGQYRFESKSTFVDRIWTNIYTLCSDQSPMPLLFCMFGIYLHFCVSYQFLSSVFGMLMLHYIYHTKQCLEPSNGSGLPFSFLKTLLFFSNQLFSSYLSFFFAMSAGVQDLWMKLLFLCQCKIPK